MHKLAVSYRGGKGFRTAFFALMGIAEREVMQPFIDMNFKIL